MKNLMMAVAAGLLAAACAPNTPQARIAQNPEKFEALPARDRELVQRGELRRGMSEDAVLLAWGSPGQRYQGSKNGKAAARWDYIGSRPVYSNWYGGGLGYGYGPYGYSRYGYANFGPDVTYVPFRIGSVWFEERRVEAWERAR